MGRTVHYSSCCTTLVGGSEAGWWPELRPTVLVLVLVVVCAARRAPSRGLGPFRVGEFGRVILERAFWGILETREFGPNAGRLPTRDQNQAAESPQSQHEQRQPPERRRQRAGELRPDCPEPTTSSHRSTRHAPKARRPKRGPNNASSPKTCQTRRRTRERGIRQGRNPRIESAELRAPHEPHRLLHRHATPALGTIGPVP